MKAIINYSTILGVTFFLFLSCTKDFVVKNIKNDLVKIISPADNDTTANNNIIFWWDELDGAEKYNLQIVKPNFVSVAQLLVDTTIIGTKFSHIFTPGTYQWRIKAINAGGATVYNTRTLIIDTTSNLIYLSVSINAPLNYSVTNSKTINFSWNPLSAANSYNLKVFSGSSTVATVIDINTANTNYSYTFSNPGIYSWKVNASNLFSNSPYSAASFFRIDQTAPQAPLLTKPTNATTVKDTTYFKWNYNSGNTDVEYDSLYISSYPDSVFTAPIKVVVPRTGIALNNSYKINLVLSSPTNTLISSPYYWWKVKSIDSVDNVSPASQVLKFKLN